MHSRKIWENAPKNITKIRFLEAKSLFLTMPPRGCGKMYNLEELRIKEDKGVPARVGGWRVSVVETLRGSDSLLVLSSSTTTTTHH